MAIPTLQRRCYNYVRRRQLRRVVETSLNIQSSDRANLLKLLEETKIRLADCVTKVRFGNRTGASMETTVSGVSRDQVLPSDYRFPLFTQCN